jgi:hypothetical protein
MKNYKIHILILRALVLAIPVLLYNVFDYFTIKLDYFSNWLSDILPSPRK